MKYIKKDCKGKKKGRTYKKNGAKLILVITVDGLLKILYGGKLNKLS